ncbi:MAG: multicomponent Na+:H+ antiporter subunit [Thermoproteota archaeon]|nr:multicomponent Na+:H+ antiporter subunit [Thermoproteota archaeon]
MPLIETFLAAYIMLTSVATLIISLYGVFYKPHLTKKIISITIFGDAVNIFSAIVGFRYIYPVAPPILLTENPTAQDLTNFLEVAVDPVPQALVLTAIVIGMAVVSFMVFLALNVFRIYHTLDTRKIAEQRKRSEE